MKEQIIAAKIIYLNELAPLCQTLKENTQLTTLDLSRSLLVTSFPFEIKALTNLLKGHETLRSLKLSQTAIDAETLCYILANMPPTLKSLDLSHNVLNLESEMGNIDLIEIIAPQNIFYFRRGSMAIADKLKKDNIGLTELDLSNNTIQDEDAAILCKPTYPILRLINLSHNQITTEGAQTLWQTLVQRKGLESIDLSANLAINSKELFPVVMAGMDYDKQYPFITLKGVFSPEQNMQLNQRYWRHQLYRAQQRLQLAKLLEGQQSKLLDIAEPVSIHMHSINFDTAIIARARSQDEVCTQQHAATLIQRRFRTHQTHNRFRTQKHSATLIQRRFRTHQTQKHSATLIQRRFRTHQTQNRFRTQKHSATLIQRHFRKLQKQRLIKKYIRVTLGTIITLIAALMLAWFKQAEVIQAAAWMTHTLPGLLPLIAIGTTFLVIGKLSVTLYRRQNQTDKTQLKTTITPQKPHSRHSLQTALTAIASRTHSNNHTRAKSTVQTQTST